MLNKGDTVGTVQGRKQEHSYRSYIAMIWGQETQRLERTWFWNDAKRKAKRTQRLDDVQCAAEKLKLCLGQQRAAGASEAGTERIRCLSDNELAAVTTGTAWRACRPGLGQ